MSESIVAFTDVLIFGIEIGVLLCLILQTLSQRRRQREEEARRQFEREAASIRRDLESLRSDMERLLQRRSTTS
jgi:sensor domain CHASE-containing protein